jgi:Holliday junction resolvase RusA-like endonuclease
MRLTVPVIPIGKPRQTRSDKWKKRPAVVQYRAFADAIRAYTERLRFILPDHGCGITFTLPMPPSWSKAKRLEMNGRPHQQKPDIDNLLKSVMDSLRGEDCTVWNVERLAKLWGEEGSITFEIKDAA